MERVKRQSDAPMHMHTQEWAALRDLRAVTILAACKLFVWAWIVLSAPWIIPHCDWTMGLRQRFQATDMMRAIQGITLNRPRVGQRNSCDVNGNSESRRQSTLARTIRGQKEERHAIYFWDVLSRKVRFAALSMAETEAVQLVFRALRDRREGRGVGSRAGTPHVAIRWLSSACS